MCALYVAFDYADFDHRRSWDTHTFSIMGHPFVHLFLFGDTHTCFFWTCMFATRCETLMQDRRRAED